MSTRFLILFALAGLAACGTGPTDGAQAGPASHPHFPPQLLEPAVSVFGYAAASKVPEECPAPRSAGRRARPAAAGRA